MLAIWIRLPHASLKTAVVTAHRDRLLGETNAERPETLELRVRVLDSGHDLPVKPREPATASGRYPVMTRLVLAAAVAGAALALAGAVAFASGRAGAPPADTRQTVAAPIDDISVVVRESNPPQVSLKIRAGLPGGCAQRHSHAVSRSGDTITVTVLNSIPTGNPICTMIYGRYDLTIDLGSTFAVGTTYIVRVNDRTTTFKT